MLEQLDTLFDFEIFENKPSEIALFLIILLVGLLTTQFLTPLISRLLFTIFNFKKKEKSVFDIKVFTEKMQKPIKRLLIGVFIYEALIQLHFPENWNLAPAFDFEIFENKPSEIALFLIILLVGLLTTQFLTPLISRLLFTIFNFKKKEKSVFDIKVFIEKMQKPIKRLLIGVFIYEALIQLHFPENWNLAPANEFGLKMFLNKGYAFIMIVMVSSILVRIVHVIGLMFLERAKTTTSRMDDQIIPFFKELIKVFIWLFSFFVILGVVFEINVAAVITGLGIGGLAVALAGKETLENLFASFMIFLDKPFVVGDWIKVADITAKVEKVGFRTTKLRTIERGLLTMPNKMMVDRPVDNLSERTVWRMQFNFGVTYGTAREIIVKIKKEIYDFLQAHPKTTQENQVYFSDFGTYDLKFTIFFFAITNDYFELMSIRDGINLKLHEIVEQSGAKFAFPTQTVHLEREDNFKQNGANSISDTTAIQSNITS